MWHVSVEGAHGQSCVTRCTILWPSLSLYLIRWSYLMLTPYVDCWVFATMIPTFGPSVSVQIEVASPLRPPLSVCKFENSKARIAQTIEQITNCWKGIGIIRAPLQFTISLECTIFDSRNRRVVHEEIETSEPWSQLHTFSDESLKSTSN